MERGSGGAELARKQTDAELDGKGLFDKQDRMRIYKKEREAT